MTIMKLYNNSSDQNTSDILDMNITTTLNQFRSDDFVESEIVLTVLQNVSMNGTIIECQSEELASKIDSVIVDSAGMHV